MNKLQFSFICTLILTASQADAQFVNRNPVTDIDVPEGSVYNTSAEESGSKLIVIQPEALKKRIELHKKTGETTAFECQDTMLLVSEVAEKTKVHGFRIQVFSDNNQKTSQREARSKEKRINERFPEYETYIVYNSPYWRLKVGDFKTEFEAEAAADDIKRAFPEFAREVRIVRDRVNVGR